MDFMEHDFFKENPLKGADAYYMRAIIHGSAFLMPVLTSDRLA